MHETSLVRSLLNQVEHIRATNNGTTVNQIEVEIGPLSGVEPLLVREAFGILVGHTNWPAAEIVIREIPLEACCRECRSNFNLVAFRFECPDCGSRSVKVTHGAAFRLLNVTLETAEPQETPT